MAGAHRRIVRLHGPGDVRLDRVAVPDVGPGDVMVAVRACGLCGSDLAYIDSGQVGFRKSSSEPLPLGHEAAGEVIATGADVGDYAIGDRVVINPIDWSSMTAIGNGTTEGAFTDRLIVGNATHPGRLLKLTDAIPYEAAALVEPMAVALHAVRRSGATARSKVAVFGAGPIGLGAVIWLKEMGVEAVAVADLSPDRRDRACRFGASGAIDPQTQDITARLIDIHGALPSGQPQTDIFIDAAAAPGLLGDLIARARFGATISVVGVYKKPQTLDLSAMLHKEISIVTSMGYPEEFGDVLAFLERNHERMAHYISASYDLDDFAEAVRAGRDPTSGKIMITV